MKYKLINPLNPTLTAQEQIMVNRGFKTREEIYHYMNLTDDDINSPEALGEDLLRRAAVLVRRAIDTPDTKIAVIQDSDCDGYTSAAILINYLYDLAPAYTENHVHWYTHEGKQHGLQDCMDWIEDIGAELVIIPDAGRYHTACIYLYC